MIAIGADVHKRMCTLAAQYIYRGERLAFLLVAICLFTHVRPSAPAQGRPRCRASPGPLLYAGREHSGGGSHKPWLHI